LHDLAPESGRCSSFLSRPHGQSLRFEAK
jgi:hypothetical protein